MCQQGSHVKITQNHPTAPTPPHKQHRSPVPLPRDPATANMWYLKWGSKPPLRIIAKPKSVLKPKFRVHHSDHTRHPTVHAATQSTGRVPPQSRRRPSGCNHYVRCALLQPPTSLCLRQRAGSSDNISSRLARVQVVGLQLPSLLQHLTIYQLETARSQMHDAGKTGFSFLWAFQNFTVTRVIAVAKA